MEGATLHKRSSANSGVLNAWIVWHSTVEVVVVGIPITNYQMCLETEIK